MAQSTDTRTAAPDARVRIMTAAAELAVERGPGNISIEAVAARAGLSKGGVLYHFRTKADLLAALVSNHIDASKRRIEENLKANHGGRNALAAALVHAYRQERETPVPPPAGVLAAVAEHPDFLCPLHAHQKEIVAGLRRESGDPDIAMILFLAIEGMKSLRLFGLDLLDRKQEESVLQRMESLLK